jgi:hypothetical protein
MSEIHFSLPKRGKNRDVELVQFARSLEELSKQIGFRLSARGWAYQLEGFRLINKDKFDLVENLINECRERGALPIDFTAEEEGRKFSGVEVPDSCSPIQFLKTFLEAPLSCEKWYTPDWWDGEKYYIQMVVEKIDLKTLFEPICQEYHICIATAKGWSSMLQRAEYARRFKEAEEKGLKCVLLYCGDHDPDGLRISEFLRSNLAALRVIHWENGTGGYDPAKLIIDRFGLNYDFIIANKLTWIDNLITGSGKNLADPSHPNNHMPYVQDYLKQYGERKCEANAIVVNPAQGQELCRQAIEKYVGSNALTRFQIKKANVMAEVEAFRVKTGLREIIQDAIDMISDSD